MILALDPGLATLGYALVRPGSARVVELGTLTSKADDAVDSSTDRARRSRRQFATLWEIAMRHDVKAIAAEAMSFGGHPASRFKQAVSLCLSWGCIVGLAHAFSVPLYEVPPKRWQRAILPGVQGKLDYDELFEALSQFVSGQTSTLSAIPRSLRNHALDAVGVGLYAALTPNPTAIHVMES